MKKAIVSTRWIGDGLTTQTARRPAILDDYPLLAFRDVTNQAGRTGFPTPNLNIVYIECEDAVMAQIEADNNYRVLHGDNFNPDAVVTTAQFNAVRTWLSNRGMTTNQMDAAIGTSAAGRTRRQIAVALLGWLAGR